MIGYTPREKSVHLQARRRRLEREFLNNIPVVCENCGASVSASRSWLHLLLGVLHISFSLIPRSPLLRARYLWRSLATRHLHLPSSLLARCMPTALYLHPPSRPPHTPLSVSPKLRQDERCKIFRMPLSLLARNRARVTAARNKRGLKPKKTTHKKVVCVRVPTDFPLARVL